VNLQWVATSAARYLRKLLVDKRVSVSVALPYRRLHVGFYAPYGKFGPSSRECRDSYVYPAMDTLAKCIKGKVALFRPPSLDHIDSDGAIGESRGVFVRITRQYDIEWDLMAFRFDIGVTTFTNKGTIRKGGH